MRSGIDRYNNKVFALNADNGRVAWKFEHKLPDDWGGYNVGFITGKHRGLAIYGDNIYFLSNDSKLHALNYMTGKVKYSKDFPGFEYPKDFAKAQDANGYATTVGPLAIPGAIIVPMNGTDFGLYDYVFSTDTNKAFRVSKQLRAGNIGINTTQRNHNTPFGGTKFSGVGRDGGVFGLHAYTELQSLVWPG